MRKVRALFLADEIAAEVPRGLEPPRIGTEDSFAPVREVCEE